MAKEPIAINGEVQKEAERAFPYAASFGLTTEHTQQSALSSISTF
jgi:hypothetical protein